MMMTQPASATGALPCVDIHFDDRVMEGMLSVPLPDTQELLARPAGTTIPGFAPGRPPLSDEVDEDSLDLDDGDDDDDEDDDEEEDEDEDGEEDEEEGDEEEDDEEDEEGDEEEDEDEEEEDDDEEEEEEEEEEEKKKVMLPSRR